jgi:hypothetical protein
MGHVFCILRQSRGRRFNVRSLAQAGFSWFCLALIITHVGSCVGHSYASQRKRNSGVFAVGFDYHLHLFKLKTYRERVLPAYRLFLEHNDASQLTSLLTEVRDERDTNINLPGPDLWSRKVYEEAIGILKGSVYYSTDGDYDSDLPNRKTTPADKRYFVETSVGPDLVLALCVPRDKGVNPEYNIGRSPLVSYLYEKSEWIKELFTSSRKVQGGELEIAIGESHSELFTKQDISKFRAELAKVPPPKNQQLKEEYLKLESLLKVAAEDSDLTLVLTLL